MPSDGPDAPLWRRLYNRWGSTLLPNHCFLCDAPSAALLCNGCEGDLPRLGNACVCCALPLPSQAVTLMCGDCLQHPKPFTRTVAAMQYAHPVDFLINRFKHQRQFSCGDFLAGELLQPLQTAYSGGDWPQLLIPVPLHWSRALARGFNQSQLIGQQLSRWLHIPLAQTCKRHRRNPRQQGLDRKERLRNLRAAFSVVAPVAGRHLALVDDVMTTGATVTELASSLRRAGAVRVDIWVLARVA